MERPLTDNERKSLRNLIRNSFDLVIDVRHWHCLSTLAKRYDKSVSEILGGILEKTFVRELKMISKEDDMLDRPVSSIRTKLERMRLQPAKLNSLLYRRGEEILTLAEIFSEEDKQSELLVTKLRNVLYPQISPISYENTPVLSDVELDNLTKLLLEEYNNRRQL